MLNNIPDNSLELKVLEKNGRNIKFSWQANNSNMTKYYIIEYKLTKGTWKNDTDRVLVSKDQTMEDVFSLKPATSYQFRIVAKNEIGSSITSNTMTIVTSEEAPSGPPVDCRVTTVSQHVLKVYRMESTSRR